MFGRKKKHEDVDWTAGLGQPVPAQHPPGAMAAAMPETPAPIEVPGLTNAQARVVNVTAKLSGHPSIQVVGNASPEQVQAAMEAAERFMNADLDGDGRVAGGAAAPGASGLASLLSSLNTGLAGVPQAAAAPAPEPDMVSQLERLAKLHDSGALTDEEFATEKGKLIGS